MRGMNQFKISKRLRCLFISLILCSLPFLLPAQTRADWEGQFKVKITGKKSMPESTGVVRMKKDRIRLDAKTPADVTTLINLKTNQAWTLLNLQKIMMEVNLKTIAGHLPLCGTKNIEECLKKQGFRKTGTETLQGHPCSLYETKNIKLWRPDQLKEVPALKTIVSSESGTTETEFSNIKMSPQADPLFVAPKNFQSVGSPQDLLKNLTKGMGAMKPVPGK